MKMQLQSAGPSTRFLDDPDEGDDDSDRSRPSHDEEDDEEGDAEAAEPAPTSARRPGWVNPRPLLTGPRPTSLPSTQHSPKARSIAPPPPPSPPPATKKKETAAMPPATTDDIRLRILNAWTRLSKGGRVPGYAEVVRAADVPGVNEKAKLQRVGIVLRGAGLGPGSRGSEKRSAAPATRVERARPAGRRTATPPPSTAAAERVARSVGRVPATTPDPPRGNVGSTLDGLRADRETAVARMIEAGKRVAAIDIALAMLEATTA